MLNVDDIPNELVDLIIHNLAPPPDQLNHGEGDMVSQHVTHPRKTDLRAVSLVSRKWRACSLRHLFLDVHVRLLPEPPTDPKVPQPFIRSLRKCKNIRSLLEFLAASPEICQCIRRLSLVAEPVCPSDIRRFWYRWRILSEGAVQDA